MSLIARLGVVLGINSSEFTKGIADADTRTKNFKKTLREAQQTADAMKTGISIAGAALVGFGVHVAGVADDMSDLADANDTTVGSIIELQHALEMSGGKAENAKVMLSAFTNAIDGAAQGSDKLRDSFKAAGVSIHDLATMSGDELRTKALAGLTEIDDAVRRNAVAMDLFGKAAKGVDFLQMSSNAEQLKGRYKEQEKAVQDAAAAFQKIKIVIADMEVAAIKAMQPISNFINELPTENKVEALAKAFTILGDVMFAAFAVKAVLGVKALSAQLTVLATKNPYLFAFLASAAAYQAYSSTNDSQATHPNMAGEEGGALIFKLGGAFAGRPTANEMEGYEKANQAFPQGTIEESKFPIRREIVVTDKQKKAIEDAKKLEQDFIEVLDSAIDRQNKFNN